MRRYVRIIFIVTVFLAMAGECLADARSYVWTYEYQTMPKGRWEVEYYVTAELPDMDKTALNTWKHLWELEYGITDRWDISMYQMLKYSHTPSSSRTEYDGFKIRTRYRFFEKGKFIVDPLIYLEYIRNGDFHKPNVIEVKFIMAKDIGNLNISYNQILEKDLESVGKASFEYTTGLNYEILPNLRAGVESKGNYSSKKYAIGPTFAFNARRIWVSLGIAFGANKKTDDMQARMICGVPF